MPADTPLPPASPSDSLTARSIRFAVTVLAPIALNLALGPQPWLVYALLTAIASYSVDNGGSARMRLAWMGGVGFAIVLGAGLGSLAAESRALTIAVFALGGVVYALSESGHQATLTLARFFCFGLAVGALYRQIAPLDVAVVIGFVLFAWAISAGWDLVTGKWRPAELPATAG